MMYLISCSFSHSFASAAVNLVRSNRYDWVVAAVSHYNLPMIIDIPGAIVILRKLSALKTPGRRIRAECSLGYGIDIIPPY